MATVQNTFTGDGSTTNFSFTFEYFEESDVKVALDNVDQATTEYSFANATTISFNTAPASNVAIRIYRQTSVDDPKAQFFAGSAIRADDLNDNNTQVRYLAQETENAALSRFGKNNAAADINMDGNRITNLANPFTGQPQNTVNNEIDAYADGDAASIGFVKHFFFDSGAETILSTETWETNDATIATTAAVVNKIDDDLASALTTEVHAADGISISDNHPDPGNITIGINDSGIALEKINTDDIVTSTETDYTSTAEGQDDGQAWVGDDTRVATLGALAKRFDNYYSTQTPSGQDYKAGTLHYNPGTAEDPDNTLFIYNGSGWETLVSGVKDFIKQNRLIWVDAALGNDARDGHRVVDPMKTIQAAVNKADDGDMIFVQPGVYKEFLPIDLGRKKNVSIIGLSMRSVFVHPHLTQKWNVTTAGSTAAYDGDNIMTAGPHGNVTSGTSEYETMFQLGSGSFVANMTLAGMKAADANGVNTEQNPARDSLHTTSEAPMQGWFFAFAENDGAGNAVKFQKSPYVQNVSAFADSAINNENYQPHSTEDQPAFGGDTSSLPTGGGLLVDGSVPHPSSPLRSFLTDAFTIICLDGPGVLVKEKGYAQLVSTFGHFCHYHAKAESGGMINMSNCTTDFGRFGLVADGQSDLIFEGRTEVTGGQNITSTTVRVTDFSQWTGRGIQSPKPVNHMVATVGTGSTVYLPIKSVTEISVGTYNPSTQTTPSEYDVEFYTPVTHGDNFTVNFYLRSTITTGGHVFEFAGAGTDYRAHPDQGGNPVEDNQVKTEGEGVVYISSSDHNGNFKVGEVFNVNTDGESVTVNGTLDATALTINGSAVNSSATYFDSNGDIKDTAMPNKITAGTSNYPTSLTVDAQGRVTSVSTDEDRFVPTYSNNTSQYLSGNGTWQNIPAGSISLDTNQSNSSKVDIEVGSGFVTLDPGLGVSFTRSGDELTIDVSTGTAFADIVTSVPSGTGSTGQLKWNSTSSIPYIWNGSSWVQFAPLSPPYGTGSVSEVIAGTGLSGGVSNGSTTGTINLADTAVTPGTYGDADTVAQFTVDQQGRVIAIANVDIALDTSDVTTGVFDLARIPTMDVAHLPTIPKTQISASNTWNVSDIPDLSATYLTAVSADTSPQLGGSLDVNGNSIVSASNGNITLNPDGAGVVSFANSNGTTYRNGNFGVTIKPHASLGTDFDLVLPATDGTNGQYLKTNGSGQLGWATDANTTYSLAGADDSGDFRIRLSDGSTDNDVKLKAGSGVTLDNSTANECEISVSAVPTGAIMWWPGSSNIPTGWKECNGEILLINDYSDLNTALGTNTYKWQYDEDNSAYTVPGGGEFNAALHFQLPDLRGEFIRGLDNGREVDEDYATRSVGTAQLDQFQGHYHSITNSPLGTSGGSAVWDTRGGGTQYGGVAVQNPTTGTNGTVRYGDETRPRNLAMIPIIKT